MIGHGRLLSHNRGVCVGTPAIGTDGKVGLGLGLGGVMSQPQSLG